MKKFSVESITWDDHSEVSSPACYSTAGFDIPSEVTIGFVIHEDAKQVVLAFSMDPSDANAPDFSKVLGIVRMSILKSCIVKRTKLCKVSI